jgi:16S rRNA processing protein RimM
MVKSAEQDANDTLVRVGIIGKAVGLKGEVYLISKTDSPDERFIIGAKFTSGSGSGTFELPDVFTLANVRLQSGRYIVRFEEISGRNDAESLRDIELFTPKSVSGDEDGWYLDDLVGLKVLHNDNEIGVIKSVINNPSQDLFEVKLNTGGLSLIPFVEQIVPEVDITKGYVVITPPPGLLELND